MITPPLVNRNRLLGFGGFLAMMAIAPLFFPRGYALSLFCQIGIMTIFALSYNMLLGQTGLLSFGHAVYYGLGAVATIHALNAVSRGALPFPVTLLPLVGGAAGLGVGLVLGAVTVRRAGTTFSMISLGIGEMVSASSLMFPAFFGGEGGVSGNRVTGKGLFGITYGPQIEMYYLIAAWAFVCTVGMYALTQTPLGRIANAVRDNPERVQFLGYDPQRVRFLMVSLGGFFAGVAGGLAALNYEIVTAEAVSAQTSGAVILMTVVGGAGAFYGPVIGAALITVLQVAVASVTKAWPFYFGLLFLVIVLRAPGGVAGILVLHRRAAQARLLGKLFPAYAVATVPMLMLAAGVVAVVELAYAAANAVETGNAQLRLPGLTLDARTALPWIASALLTFAGVGLLSLAWRDVARRWQAVQAALSAGGQP
jgi:branched-chain amino acid transport system permease protein